MENGENKRLIYVDVLRVIACFLVILTHSSMPMDSSSNIYLALISFISTPATQLFFALSGTVLLPVKMGMKAFYKKRFLKLLPPVFFWSIVTMLVYVLVGKETSADALISIFRMPIYPVIGVYWFVYVMIGLYLLAPFVSPWLISANKKQVQLFLGLWSITLLLPYLNAFYPGFYSVTGNYYFMLNAFGGYLGYWILGYYLRLYPIKKSLNKTWLIVLILFVLFLALVAYFKVTGANVEVFMGYLQIGNALCVVVIYTIVQNLVIKSKMTVKIISEIAKYSFGIYLIHIIVVREFVWRFFEASTINPFIGTLVIAVISFGLSYTILKILSKIPYSKFIVGC
jgi:surface polysaccharide O-acyltransferase-like enzyme